MNNRERYNERLTFSVAKVSVPAYSKPSEILTKLNNKVYKACKHNVFTKNKKLVA